MPHLEIFQNAAEFHTRMAQLNATAVSIFAINFSYPPDQKKEGPLVDYYNALHDYINQKDGRLESFRVIVNVRTPEKASWTLNRVMSFEHNSKFSLAITPTPYPPPLQLFHIVESKSGKYVFVFPPIPKHDSMRSFMIVDDDVADLLIAQFNDAWTMSIKLIEGGVLDHANMEKLDGLQRT
jgi:hypothetical protein